jgi:histone H3/H4
MNIGSFTQLTSAATSTFLMTRLKTLGSLTRKPDDTHSAVKTPRKQTQQAAVPPLKGILKKRTSAPVDHITKKSKKREVLVQEIETEEDENEENEQDTQPQNDEEDETVDDRTNALVDQEAIDADGDQTQTKHKPNKSRKVDYHTRRLKRVKLLQKSIARLGTEKGFKRVVNHIQATSTTGSLNGKARFSRDALQNMQAAVESLLHKVLSNTAQQVYTIKKRKSRIDKAHIAVSAEQNFLSMKGAQFVNDYRDARQM